MKKVDLYINLLIAPVTLRVLLIGLALGLVNGISVLILVDRGAVSEITDLAGSYALIVLLSFALGSLIAAAVSDAVNVLIRRLLTVLTLRMNRLSERIAALDALYDSPSRGNDRPNGTTTANFFTAACVYGYVVGIGLSSIMLVYAILANYIYADEPLPIGINSLVAGAYVYSTMLFAIALLCVLLIVSRIALRWKVISGFEKQVALLEVSMGVQHAISENTSMSAVIDRVNEKILRFMGIHLDEGIRYSSLHLGDSAREI